MKINLLMKLHTEDNSIVLTFTKVYESNIIPSMGTKIKDSIFAQYKSIVEIALDYQNDECFVTIEPKLETKERLSGHIQEVAELHNWVLLS